MKKYYLVDPVRYETLMKSFNAQKSLSNREELFSHPNVKKTKEIDREIGEILNDQNTTDYEKNERFNSKLNDYVRNFRTAISTSKREALLGKPSSANAEPPATSEVIPLSLEDKLSSIPDSYQQNAKKLISFLKRNTAFSWNEKGELKYKDNPIQGSDVVQLLHDAVRTKEISSNSKAFEEFVDALKREGYPIQKTLKQKKKVLPFKVVKRKTVSSRKHKSTSKLSSPSIQKDILKSWVSTN